LLVTILTDKQITILWDEEPAEITLAQKQNKASKRFSADMKAIDDEPLDEEFFAIINSRVGIDSGVNL
jgi:hypothetical protein